MEAWSGRKKAEASGTFETALLKDSDWTGRWAGSNAVFTDTTTVVRKDFRVEEKEVARARVYLLGIGYHELYVNGKKVGDGYLAPSNSDYTKSLYYKTYDITPFLSAGVNAIASSWVTAGTARRLFCCRCSRNMRTERAGTIIPSWTACGG